MAGDEATDENGCNERSKECSRCVYMREVMLSDDCEELEKVLSLVVKRRKTFPAKCMELNKRTANFELLRLENSKVITEEDSGKEEFRKIVQEFRNQKSFHFTLDDLNEVEQKFEKYRRRNEEVRKYLEKRNMSQCN